MLGDAITAIIPCSDDYLIFGATNSMQLLRGDPAIGGVIDIWSPTIGVLGGNAHVVTPDGTVYFMSQDGLYKTNPAINLRPTPVSRKKLPGSEVANISPQYHEVFMVYDATAFGIHVFVTERVISNYATDTFPARHYWFDLESEAFWPLTLARKYGPTSAIRVAKDAAVDSIVLLGGREGQLRYFNNNKTASNDDGLDFFGEITIGPLGNIQAETLMTELHCSMALGSGNVEWYVSAGDDAEAAAFQTLGGSGVSQAAGIFSQSANYTARPRLRGRYLYVHLRSRAGSRRWTFEQMHAVVSAVGKIRRSG
jgi:hypothetical protein